MKVLYITGNNLQYNNSANMSHNAFLKGLIDNGAAVDVIMAQIGYLKKDDSMPYFEEACYHEYKPTSWINDFVEKLKNRRGNNTKEMEVAGGGNTHQATPATSESPLKSNLRTLYYKSLKLYCGVHDQHIFWVKNAMEFRSDKEYDLILSNSSPNSAHLLAEKLIDSGHVKTKRWVQVWEDPWYFDLYGTKDKRVYKEEHRLLSKCNEIYYVSPLTCYYQKKYFPDAASRMRTIPLPYLDFSSGIQTAKGNRADADVMCIGYFGDYHSYVRNILPLYEAVKQEKLHMIVCGNTDLNLKNTDTICIHGRVGLHELANYQEQANVLVHLSNLRGGQIPGKVYHYSATDKIILFILDGTEEEKEMLKSHFEKYQRFIFCDNTEESITDALGMIKTHIGDFSYASGLQAFEPQTVVKQILEKKV